MIHLPLNRNATSNKYCVPTALSFLTGLHVDEVEKELREFIGDLPITGMYSGCFLNILKKYGYSYKRVDPKPITIHQFMKDQFDKLDTYAIIVDGHILVGHGCMIFDNSNVNGIPYSRYPNRNCKLIYKVWK